MRMLIVFFMVFFIAGVSCLVALKKLALKFLGIAFLIMSVLIAVSYLNLRNYSAFTREELVAKVKIEKVRGELYDMALTFIPVKKGSSQEAETYLLKGNQWMIDGDILKWKPALNAAGFKTAYKITRISGRYLLPAQQLRDGQTIYTVNGGTDRLWVLLHKYQKFFPFVEAVYGNGAYAFAHSNQTFGVYVTTSGFMVKEYNEK